ncbi:MAG: chromosome segregation protein SMC [Firmicutes bacterium]|nr:chromosome segregation protein SMC [Bacillota bacterium]
MYFKRLEMQGFKSFADPVVIDFHEGITCIVGPNGSGKSNISDAIRWVLGEQSPKALRGGKMEEVIFAGTASRKSRGMAEVTLVIDNTAGILDIDYSEVAITRRMYRSGESEYLINNNPCRLRDIRELIMDTGIGVDGYSLIGQGRIADIVSTKPESRREIFEEAAGVVMYKNRRNEASRKLDSTSQNLERVNDIIEEIEGRIGNLRDDSTKAKEYLDLKDRYEGLEINLILRNIESAEENAKAYEQEIGELSEQLDRLMDAHSEVSEKGGKLSERRTALDGLIQETQERIIRITNEINTITSNSKISAERLSSIEKEDERIRQELDSLRDMLETEEESLRSLDEERRKLNFEDKVAETHLRESISAYNEAVAIHSGRVADAEEKRQKLFDLSSEKNNLISQISGVENLSSSLSERREELLSLRSDAENSRAGAEKDKAGKEEVIRARQGEMDAAGSELESVRSKTAALRKELSDMVRSNADARIDLSTLNSRHHTLKEMEENYEGFNYGVRSVMKGSFPGVRGVAAELMTVPKGFETAMETALGASAQNLICERDADAKRCITYLKQNKAGRVTFLPMETIRGSKADFSAVSGAQGFLGLASELIKCDPEYRAIFDNLLGRTVVADNMDHAVSMSKKTGGIRFVTLDGEVVSPAGAITGGTYRNKSQDIFARKAEISELEERIKILEGKISAGTEAIEERRARIAELAGREEVLSGQIHSMEVAFGALRGELKASEDNLDREDRTLSRYDSEIRKIDDQLAEAEEMTSANRKRVAEIIKETEELEGEIERAQALTEEARDELDKANENVTACRIEKNAAATKAEAQERLAAREEDIVNAYRLQIGEKESTLRELKAEAARLGDTDSMEEELEDLKDDGAHQKKKLEEMLAKRGRVVEELDEISRIQNSSADKINDLQDRQYQLKMKSGKAETLLDTYKEKLFEEFEISYAQAADRRDSDFVYSKALKENREIKNRIKELGDVNVGAISEYEQVSERYEFLTTQREDILKARDELIGIINEMDRTIKTRFKDNFDKVVENFEVIFKELFGGGQAELRLENEQDPLNSGIDIVAQPPGKKLQNINLMSGGEKTMTAIALMFAVLKTKPTPFCILDEVEAALDDNNIDRFANYLKNFENIQFALVTHQKATMEHADVLYGVTMPEQGISKMLSLRLGDDFDLGGE